MAESPDRSHAERLQEILHRWRALLDETQPGADCVEDDCGPRPRSSGAGTEERGPTAA